MTRVALNQEEGIIGHVRAEDMKGGPGTVKLGSFLGRNITVSDVKFNRGSLINYLNYKHLETSNLTYDEIVTKSRSGKAENGCILNSRSSDLDIQNAFKKQFAPGATSVVIKKAETASSPWFSNLSNLWNSIFSRGNQ